MNSITIRGARCHNLKNITVSIPRGKLIVVTGISGSGKSSLIFDTLYAEGQRRYLESLSGSSHHFRELRERPDVDAIDGLTPTISISQTFTAFNPRSTVGTMSDIYDYLRILFTRIGVARGGQVFSITPTPRSFSFNNPLGACEKCEGLGVRLLIDPELILPNKRLSIIEGAIKPLMRLGSERSHLWKTLIAYARSNSIDTSSPVGAISALASAAILHGREGEFQGVIPHLEKYYRETDSPYVRAEIEQYMRESPCDFCRGSRLNNKARSVVIGENISLDMLTAMSISDLRRFFEKSLKIAPRMERLLIQPIRERLELIERVGLSYLTLNRSIPTLAGGEVLRLRIAVQIGIALSGVTYILDEPTQGLHAKNISDLLHTLASLCKLGNTVIVIEHDRAIISAADYVIDMGPGAGENGGRVLYAGDQSGFQNANTDGETARHMRNYKKSRAHIKRRAGNGKHIIIKGASEHNLKFIDASFPLGMLVGVTGVSGSGKSTLVHDILARALSQKLHRAKHPPGAHREISGIEFIDKVITVDQSPIGRTPRSNPATFIGAFMYIRDFFATLPESKKRKYGKGYFSFNVPGGRCETCAGNGEVRIEMYFLPCMYTPCGECGGSRYSRDALYIKWKMKTIADILAMTVTEALNFLGDDIPQIVKYLRTLGEVGLGYLKLGQSATTLSGGEAQRVKLAVELARPGTGRTLYILDEPTIGLHFVDIKHLMDILHALVLKGNTVIIIEHNIDVIAECDWLLDLGPDGGENGGRVVAFGTPDDVSKTRGSYTGQFLRELFLRT